MTKTGVPREVSPPNKKSIVHVCVCGGGGAAEFPVTPDVQHITPCLYITGICHLTE